MFALHFRRAALLGTAVVSSVTAQRATSTTDPDGTSGFMRRSAFSLSVIQSRPQGTFGRNVGLGYGLDGAYLLRLDDAGVWSLRASIGAVGYGGETRRAAFSETVGGRVLVDVTTTNYIVPMSVGPQVSWPKGLIRPYANAGVGAQVFFTESQVRGSSGLTPIASTTNHSSSTTSWSAGGGVYVPLRAGRTRVDLDFGVQYVAGGTARYLAKGSIVDLPGAQISVTPMESRTHMAIVRLGARVRP